MAATKIKVKLTSLEVHDKTGTLGPGEWLVDAKVRRDATGESTQLGNPGQSHEALAPNIITLNSSTDLAVTAKDTKFVITVSVQDISLSPPGDMGKVEVTINTPIVHTYNLHIPSSKGRYTAAIEVAVLASTPEKGGPITTIVQNNDSSTYNTVHDEMLSKMVHICPVIPVPWTNGTPPVAKGCQALSASPQVDLSVAATASDPNALVNPAVIPVLEPLDADFDKKCGRIRITQYRPADLDLSKIIWKAATANIKLWNGSSRNEIKGGQEVKAYGVLSGADEEGKIEVRWDGPGTPLLAEFRCWVGKPKYIWTRINIVKCSQAKIGTVPLLNPVSTAATLKAQLAYNNVMLWQAGVMMVLDTDKTCYNGAKLLEDGIFEITTATNHTFNIADTPDIVAPILNSREGVFNVAYMHSIKGSPNLNGMATDRRLSDAAEGTASLGGSPSTSWVRPTGVYPDEDGKDVTMKTMERSDARKATQKSLCGDGAIDKISGCIMTNKGATNPGSVTLAHELGHVLMLHHRGSGGGETWSSYDGVNHLAGPNAGIGHPWNENLLTYGPNTRRQDLDMLQAKVMRAHKLCKDAPPGATPPKPKQVLPVPEAYHKTEADRILLQEYLVGKKPGLQHTGYNLGTSGPDGDGVDGIVGPKTKQAIKDFQRDHGGLTKDGIYGPKTRAAFDNELNGTPEPTS